MTLALAQQILGAFPGPVYGGTRGENSKDLTVRQLAVLLAVEHLGATTTADLAEHLPGTQKQLARPLDQLLDRLLLACRDGVWTLTLKGKAVLGTAPSRQPQRARAPVLRLPDCPVVDLADLLACEEEAEEVPAPAPPPAPKATSGVALLVQDAEQAVARAELLHKDERSVRSFEVLNAAYDDLAAARQAAKEEAKPGPKAKPKKPKHKGE